MRHLAVIAVFLFCSMLYSVQFTEAKPSKRYDERTKMCRVLTSSALDWDSGLWGMGNDKFISSCQSCHSKGNSSGAPFVHVETYTSDGWNAFFSKRNRVCATDGSWDTLTDDELQIVNDFLYRNGDWTYDPNNAESCG